MVIQDVPRHVVLLASIDDELIGIGEFVVTDTPEQAEVAFAVADDHHREGVATLLLERLALAGRRCGLQRLVAKTLPGNHDMLLVFSTVGLAQQAHFADGIVEVTLDLDARPPRGGSRTQAEQALQHRRDDEHRSDRTVAK
jgi:GNAT superfamily N-acetyltransferase